MSMLYLLFKEESDEKPMVGHDRTTRTKKEIIDRYSQLTGTDFSIIFDDGTEYTFRINREDKSNWVLENISDENLRIKNQEKNKKLFHSLITEYNLNRYL